MNEDRKGVFYGSRIVPHDCPVDGDGRDYQYKTYGVGRVVANACRDGFRCTICGAFIPG